MGERPGIGVIGAGAVAVLRHLPAFAQVRAAGDATIAAIYDLDPERARRAAAEFAIPAVCESVEALLALPSVTAVSICTPNAAHYAQALAALAAGKHVLCEKPLALTLAEARAMTAAADAAGVVTAVNFRYRWIPAARYVSDLVASGALGRLYQGVFHYVNGSMADPATPAAWRAQRAQAGTGVLGDLGSHLIDLAASWLGEATAVTGDLRTFTTDRPDGRGGRTSVDTDDTATFTVSYDSGALGQFLVSRAAAGRGNFQRIELYGSGGGVTYAFDRWDRGGDVVAVCLGGPQARHAGYATAQVSPDHLLGTPVGPMLEWVAAMIERRPASPSFADGLRCQEIMAAIEASAAAGRRVALPLP